MRIINFNDGFTSAAAPAVEMLASSVSVTPSTNLVSTDAQAALTELANEIVPHIANLSNPHVVTKTQVGLSAVTNDAQVKRTEMGATSGVATLDSGGKVPTSQLPDAVVGSVKYQGTWNALTNTPTLVTSTGSKGDYYVVSSDGTTNLNGTTDWKIGDWAIFNGSGWQKIDNTDAIASVNGYTGVVVLAKADVGLGNVDNTSDATKNAAAAVLTNKDHDGGTASNTSRLTVPKAALSTLTGLTRKQGTLVYDTTANALLADDGTNLNTIGSGSGEKNYIAAPSTASGWTASGAGITVATDSTAADLPRPNTSKTGILLTGVSGSTAYAYYRFILDDADAGKKLKVQFDMKPGTAVASDFKVDVYSNTASDYTTGNTRRSLSTDVSAVSALPALTGTYRTTFDAPAVSAKWIEVRIGLNAAATHTLVVSDVVVGPGVVVQGAAVSEWVSYTPTITNTSGVKGASPSSDSARWRRVGDTMELAYQFAQANAGTAGTGLYLISIPSGYTIDSAKLASTQVQAAAYNVLGTAELSLGSGGTSFTLAAVKYGSSTAVYIEYAVGTANTAWDGASIYNLAQANLRLTLLCRIPIAEWAGSGTVNVVQNDVEYAWNSSATTSTDAVNFGYGPGGVLFQNFAAATTAHVDKRVRFQTPIQVTDRLEVEVNDGTAWVPIVARLGGFRFNDAATAAYGCKILTVNSTDVDVAFYSTIDNSSAWSAVNTWKWRVRKVSGGQAVGFSEVQPGVSSGLVSANGLKGVAANNNAATGYVGEYIEAKTSLANIAASATTFDATSILLSAGDWDVNGAIVYSRNGATFSATDMFIGIAGTSGASFGTATAPVTYIDPVAVIPTNFTTAYLQIGPLRVQSDGTNLYINGNTYAGTQTVYLKAYCGSFTVASAQFAGFVRARRIR